jgi:hypothetical protein
MVSQETVGSTVWKGYPRAVPDVQIECTKTLSATIKQFAILDQNVGVTGIRTLLVPDILITVTLSSGLFSMVTVNTEPERTTHKDIEYK